MSPIWIGPYQTMVYQVSHDGGKNYRRVQKQILFGTFFFVSDLRRELSRDAFMYFDLLAKVGGLFSIIRAVMYSIAQVVNTNAFITEVIEQIYFYSKGPKDLNLTVLTYWEWISYPFTFCCCKKSERQKFHFEAR